MTRVRIQSGLFQCFIQQPETAGDRSAGIEFVPIVQSVKNISLLSDFLQKFLVPGFAVSLFFCRGIRRQLENQSGTLKSHLFFDRCLDHIFADKPVSAGDRTNNGIFREGSTGRDKSA